MDDRTYGMSAQGGGGATMDDGGAGGASSGGTFPVDDATYDLISALASKLESIEVMERYAEDDDSGIFEAIGEEDRRHAERLLDALRQRLAQG